MPHTQEELQKLDFYIRLTQEDEQQYLQKKAALELEASISGSANQGAIVRDGTDAILLFEDPYKNELLEDESSKVVYNLRVNTLKTKESDTIIDEVLDRRFREL